MSQNQFLKVKSKTSQIVAHENLDVINTTIIRKQTALVSYRKVSKN